MTPLFELHNVTVRYAGEATAALSGFSLRIEAGEKIVLRGASGSGKSTILRLLLGFVQPESGQVRFRGAAMTPDIAWAARRETTYVSQQTHADLGTVGEFLRTMAAVRGSGDASDELFESALERLALSREILPKSLADLSGGERQRVLLASALCSERPALILDEPTSSLDGALKERARNYVLEACATRTVIAAAHDEVWFDAENLRIVDLTP